MALTSRTVAAAVVIAAVVLVLMGVQPILVGLYADHLHLTLSQSGWVIAAEQWGGGSGALVGFWLSTRVRWRSSIVCACAIAAAASIVTALAWSFAELLPARFIAGAAATLAYTVAIYCLGHTKTPDRVFGVVFVLQTVFMSADAIALATLASRVGYGIAIGSAAAWFVSAIVAAQWLPQERGPPHATAPQENVIARNPALGVAALAGSFLLQFSVFAVWGFLERVGRRNGLSDQFIGYAIGIGVLGGIPGGFLAAAVGARFGRLRMISAATVLLVLSYAALSHELGWSSYGAWIICLNLGWVLGMTYYMGLAVHNDPDGRFTRLLPFMQTFGAAVGPACSALATVKNQLWPIFLVASLAGAAGLAVVLGTAALGPGPRQSANGVA